MGGVKDIEHPLAPLGAGLAVVQGHQPHAGQGERRLPNRVPELGRVAHPPQGRGKPAEIVHHNIEKGHHRAQGDDAGGLALPEQVGQQNAQHPKAAVVRAQNLAQQDDSRHGRHRRPGPAPALAPAELDDLAAGGPGQQGEEHVEKAKGQGTGPQGQAVGNLGEDGKKQQPPQVAPGAVGVHAPLGDAVGEDGKGHPAHIPHGVVPREGEQPSQHRRRVVDEHGRDGHPFQNVPGHGDASFFKGWDKPSTPIIARPGNKHNLNRSLRRKFSKKTNVPFCFWKRGQKGPAGRGAGRQEKAPVLWRFQTQALWRDLFGIV